MVVEQVTRKKVSGEKQTDFCVSSRVSVTKGIRVSSHSPKSNSSGQSNISGANEHSQRSLKARKLTQVYKQYGHLVVRICREVLRQQEDAEDAMHETFIKFWRYVDTITEPREIVAMLRRIALSTSIDSLRTRQRQGRYGEAWREMRKVVHAEHIDSVESRKSSRQLVAMLLQAVRVDRETVEMAYHYYLDEMTLEEVAKATNYSRRAVGMKLQRFRENAAKYCQNHGITW